MHTILLSLSIDVLFLLYLLICLERKNSIMDSFIAFSITSCTTPVNLLGSLLPFLHTTPTVLITCLFNVKKNTRNVEYKLGRLTILLILIVFSLFSLYVYFDDWTGYCCCNNNNNMSSNMAI